MQTDVGDLRRRAEDAASKARRAGQEDVVIESPRRLLIRSPNGHYWAVSVDDAGVLHTTDAGISL